MWNNWMFTDKKVYDRLAHVSFRDSAQFFVKVRETFASHIDILPRKLYFIIEKNHELD